jgi:hypothetical protein
MDNIYRNLIPHVETTSSPGPVDVAAAPPAG